MLIKRLRISAFIILVWIQPVLRRELPKVFDGSSVVAVHDCFLKETIILIIKVVCFLLQVSQIGIHEVYLLERQLGKSPHCYVQTQLISIGRLEFLELLN